MTSSTIFSLPVPVYEQVESTRRRQYQSKRRKRHSIADPEDTKYGDALFDSEQTHRPESQHSSQYSEYYAAVLTPDERSQHSVAGQPFDRVRPAKPFPHAPVPNKSGLAKTTSSIPNCLASLDPPIYADSSESRKLTLHQQHLAIVTAILHKSLSERDYVRAGRALSLILRDEIGGRALDIRAEGRWGIGAEILLRQGAQREQQTPMPQTDSPMNGVESDMATYTAGPWCTRQGFEDAKRYYERLIIQYPFHKHAASAVSALDFYPAMFGLWIYVVQAESQLNTGQPHRQVEVHKALQSNPPSPPDKGPLFSQSSKGRTLEQAREIAARMDACMTTIPYSDDVELLRLRGMVALWLADLIDDLADGSSDADTVDDAGGDHATEAERARHKASDMFRRIRGDADSQYG